MRLIEIGNNYYYAGLNWETISATENVKKKIKEFGKGYYALRSSGGMANIGYSDDLEGSSKFKKYKSLASDVADAKKEPWMGVFELSNGLFWYIAVRDNQAIVPDGDVIGTKDEIDKVFSKYIAIGEKAWDTIIDNGTEKDLIELLTGKGVFVKKAQPNYYFFAIFLVLLALAVFFYYFIRAEKQKQIKKVSFVPKVFAPKKIVKIPGYKTLPKPVYLYNACKKRYSELADVSGWKPVSLMCSNTFETVVYKRQFFGNAMLAPDGNLNPDGNMITQTKSLNAPAPKNFRKLLTRKEVIKEVYGIFQEFDIPYNITAAQNKINIKFNGRLDFLPVFFTIPTFRIEQIKFSNLNSDKADITAEVWFE